MNQKKTRRRQRIKLTFTYAVMTLTVLSLVVVSLFLTQGYRYNWYKNKVEQGGMVQFDSRPNGASIQIDDAWLANTTATRITASAGQHTVTISKNGYDSWQKKVNVEPGSVLWLNYVKLIPKSLNAVDALEIDDFSSAASSPDYTRLALIEDAERPRLKFIKLNGKSASAEKITIPKENYTTDGVENHQFSAIRWSRDSKRVLIEHKFDGSREFIIVNLAGEAQNITRNLGVNIAELEFDPSDSQNLYVLTSEHDLRRIRLNDETLSGPIVSNVSNFAISNDGWLSYATRLDDNGERAVGYVSKGASKARTLRTFSDKNSHSLRLAIEVYYNERFAAISHGGKVDILKSDLPASDSSREIKTQEFANFSMPSDVAYLGFSPKEFRYIYAQSGQKIKTYDLELKFESEIEPEIASKNEIAWLDYAHVLRVANGVLEIGDYDGTNMHVLARDALGSTATQISDGRYIYYFREKSGKKALAYLEMYN